MRRIRSERRRKRLRRRIFRIGFLVIVICITAVIFLTRGNDAEEETQEIQTAEAKDLVIETGVSVGEELEVNELEGLQTELESMLADADGNWSIYVENLETENEITINNQRMYAASLIKLYVMQSCFEHMDMVVENDSIYSGDVQQSEEKVDELLTNMIEVSDNEAYNELVRMHSDSRSFTEGCLFIEDYLQGTEYADTGIFHTLSPSNTESESTSDTENYTCVEDCGHLLESIYNGTCVSESASEQMLDLLMGQQVTTKIPAGLPEGVLVANKTGETDEVQHDVAIVYGPEADYILCVMVSDFRDSEEVVSEIQHVSSVVYSWINE